VSARQALARLRRPVRSARGVVRRLATGPGLPLGHTARIRRLLSLGLERDDRVLVVGPVAAVRQALPGVPLDIVGVDPHDPAINVVSDGEEEGSLPRRWSCIVVTDPAPTAGRLLAAAGAALPGGVLALVRSRGEAPLTLPGVHVERSIHGGGLQLVLARVSE
jgi:hypothetical protein